MGHEASITADFSKSKEPTKIVSKLKKQRAHKRRACHRNGDNSKDPIEDSNTGTTPMLRTAGPGIAWQRWPPLFHQREQMLLRVSEAENVKLTVLLSVVLLLLQLKPLVLHSHVPISEPQCRRHSPASLAAHITIRLTANHRTGEKHSRRMYLREIFCFRPGKPVQPWLVYVHLLHVENEWLDGEALRRLEENA